MNIHPSKTLRNYVNEFNAEIKSKPSYNYRRKTLATSVIFYDYKEETPPSFHMSPADWCIIKESQISSLSHPENYNRIIKFEANEEEKVIENSIFNEESLQEQRNYLIKLAHIYLNLHKDLASNYSFLMRQRVYSKINELRKILSENAHILIEKSQMIRFLRREIKNAKHNRITVELEKVLPLSKTEIMNGIIQRKREGIHTVNEICKEFNISRTTYYVYCRIKERNSQAIVRPQGRPLNEFSLNQQEKEEIKKMADNPSKSYTVPEMCAELNEKYNRNITHNKVNRYLTKDLLYSFKRNTYAAPPAFDSAQKIVRYKVCKHLIDSYESQMMGIYIDESGFDLSICSERSWAPIGEKPYRKRSSKFQRINIIMAITKDRIFAYKAVKGGINENHFIEFIQQILYKIHSENPRLVPKVLCYMNNHRTHTSQLAEKFFRMTEFEFLYSPIAYYQLNAIELLFGYLKRKLKTKFFNNP